MIQLKQVLKKLEEWSVKPLLMRIDTSGGFTVLSLNTFKHIRHGL